MTAKYTYLLAVCVLLAACAKDSSAPFATNQSSNTGVGGSQARFAIVGNILYTIDNQSLTVFGIETPADPIKMGTTNLGIGIETVYALGDKLLIGANDGMHIYDISQPATPVFVSLYTHILACDPVVAQGTTAYVTLHTTRTCRNNTTTANQLEVVDISNPSAPQVLNIYNLDGPEGMGIDGNVLMVCDANTLRAFDSTQPANLQPLGTLPIAVQDVIMLGGSLIAVGTRTLYLIDYTDPQHLHITAQIRRLAV